MKHSLNRISIFFIFCFFIGLRTISSAQFVDFSIVGPYEPIYGNFQIKTYIHFLRLPSDPWIDSTEAVELAQGMMDNLNGAFNEHGIYFFGENGNCSEFVPNVVITSDTSVLYVRNNIPGGKHSDGIDIYVQSITGAVTEGSGWAYGIPNTYILMRHAIDTLPSVLSPILIHEIGHLFGLLHNWEREYGTSGAPADCPPQVICPTLADTCNCCFDFVCDTPSEKGLECGVDTFASNYMTSSDSWLCRDNFTPQQVARMRVHLQDSDTLQNIQFKSTYPGGTINNPSGDIYVESGTLAINSLLEMLPGSHIFVRPGAHLKVNATITGACGAMWGGVIVEGSQSNLSQDTTYQGRVTVSSTGRIEHAEIGIDVMNVIVDQLEYGSGGIVVVSSGFLINCTIGIRFGGYGSINNNKSYFAGARFAITDDYRDSLTTPVFVEILGITGLNMVYCYFQDNRSVCTNASKRAIGISSFNTGFRITSSQFNNLSVGVDARGLTDDAGSFQVTNSNFYKCYANIRSLDMTGFAISGNDFYMNKVSACPTTNGSEIIGVQIKGNTLGFVFNDNLFSLDGDDPPDTLIGTKCIDLGEGMGNVIWGNEYISLNYGNVAIGTNNGINDGLLYLCNEHSGTYNMDYHIPGVIRLIQEENDGFNKLPTGIKFSEDGDSYTIKNSGANIKYRFFSSVSLAPLENPWIAMGPLGVDTIPSAISNPNCNEVEPCIICPESEKEILKTRFAENKELWLTKLDNVPNINNEIQLQLELDTIRMLRVLMNKDAGKLVRQYALDTNTIKGDSILVWLKLAQTFEAELEIAKHLFFSKNFTAFDLQLEYIENNYGLSEYQTDVFNRLTTMYTVIRNEWGSEIELHHLPESTLDSLLYFTLVCDEAAWISEIVLWRNGMKELPTPCSEPEYRNSTSFIPKSNNVKKLLCYPNPADSSTKIVYPESNTPGHVIVFDFYGKQVFQAELAIGSTNCMLNFVGFSGGQYFVRAYWMNGTAASTKLILKPY